MSVSRKYHNFLIIDAEKVRPFIPRRNSAGCLCPAYYRDFRVKVEDEICYIITLNESLREMNIVDKTGSCRTLAEEAFDAAWKTLEIFEDDGWVPFSLGERIDLAWRMGWYSLVQDMAQDMARQLQGVTDALRNHRF